MTHEGQDKMLPLELQLAVYKALANLDRHKNQGCLFNFANKKKW